MNISVNPNSGIYSADNQINMSGRQVISEASEVSRNVLVDQDKVVYVKAGDIISGQITELEDDGALTLLLGNNATIKAQVSSDLSVNIGQMLSFQVKGASSSSITLIPLYANLDNNSPVAKALTAANLPITAETAKMVGAMMERGLPIDIGSLQAMSQKAASHPLADPVTIVQMTEIGIPLTEDNVMQFEAYKEGQYQIAESAGSLAEGFVSIAGESPEANQNVINTFLGEVSTDTSTAVGQALNGNSAQLMTLLGVQESARPEIPNVMPQAEVIPDVNASARISPEPEMLEGGSGGKDAGTGLGQNADEKEPMSFGSSGKDIIADGKSGAGEGKNVNTDSAKDRAVADERQASPKGDQLFRAASFGKSAESIISESEGGIKATNPLPDSSMLRPGAVTDDLIKLLGTEGTKKIADALKNAGIPEEVTEKIASGDATTKQVMDVIRSVIREANSGNIQNEAMRAAVDELIKSEPYSFLLRNEITRQFLLEPSNVADADKVKEYYERIVKQADNALEMLKSMGKSDTPLAEGMQSLKSNIDFMNGMNNVMTYVQLPLKLNDSAAHGDLYVYTNKKKLAKKDGNCTALLHLDMEHLGPVDIHVTMRDYDKISTHFILQSEELLDFIAAHLPELDSNLERRGYHMHSDVSLNKEPKSVPEIMFNQGSNAKLIQKTSFDVRA